MLALDELRREPAAAIFARAHAGPRPSADEALFRTVLLGLLVSTAEACGGFDWDDEAFDRAYGELERSLFGERRTYARSPRSSASRSRRARAGSRAANPRRSGDGELARHWPEANSLAPNGFGREADRYCVLELRAALGAGEEPPDAPAEIADAVSALRLATAAPLAAGPVLFETLDGRPFGIRPVLPIAATQPPGEPTRLDSFRGGLAAELLVRLGLADADTALAEALDRWELSLFQHDPFRSEQLRAALAALLGDTWPLRAAVLLEDEPESRGALHAELAALADGGERERSRGRRGAAGARRGAPHTATARRSCASSTARCSGRRRRGAASPSSAGARASASAGTKPAPKPAQTRDGSPRYGRGMEEARRVLERLDRIEALERAAAGPAELLGELRALLAEAEEWARVEGGDPARRPSSDCAPRSRVTRSRA